MKSVRELTQDELNELRSTYFEDFKGLLKYDYEDEVTDKELFDYYGAVYFVEEDFFCNL